jgi:hypothetical protein
MQYKGMRRLYSVEILEEVFSEIQKWRRQENASKDVKTISGYHASILASVTTRERDALALCVERECK